MNLRAKKKPQSFSPEMDKVNVMILEEQSLRNFMYNNSEIFEQFTDWRTLGDTDFRRRDNGSMPNGISSVVRKAVGYGLLMYRCRMGYKLTPKGKEYLNGQEITV